jgi:hypothetical protein
VVVVAEFNHAQERVVVPTVVGPNLIRKQGSSDQPRYGVVLLDTRVTGPHPYRGGDVDISVSFYQVQRANHARALLKVVDSLSAALGAPGELQTIAKAGGALLQGVEGLLGLRETTCLAGHRISMATSPFDPIFKFDGPDFYILDLANLHPGKSSGHIDISPRHDSWRTTVDNCSRPPTNSPRIQDPDVMLEDRIGPMSHFWASPPPFQKYT